MGHHDAPGNGQSQPVATGLTVAGLVRPVKPIEEMGEFFPLQRLLDGIGEHDILPIGRSTFQESDDRLGLQICRVQQGFEDEENA